MVLSNIENTVNVCQTVIYEMKQGGLTRPSLRLEKIVKMISALNGYTDAEAKTKLASKPYQSEIKVLMSAASDIKGLKDMCPNHLPYEDWRNELSRLKEAVEFLQRSIAE